METGEWQYHFVVGLKWREFIKTLNINNFSTKGGAM
jgi:hypothetical protein